MVFIYTRYEYLLGQKTIQASLKNDNRPQTFELKIITPAVKFIEFPIGGGLVKMSRLYSEEGKLIHARNYSTEIKQEVKAFKQTLSIPYLQLWKGFLIILAALIIGSVIYGIKLKGEANNRAKQTQKLDAAVADMHVGQLYGATFFTDESAHSINGLPYGWVKIIKIDGDTLFAQRSKQQISNTALFDINKLLTIKPKTENDWSEKIEKFNYALLKQGLGKTSQDRYDLLYIGADNDTYSGVSMSFKGVE